jgi:hypothetical protein
MSYKGHCATVPTSRNVKGFIGSVVALGAYALAFLSQNMWQEVYLCSLSVIGTFIGVGLQAHLNSSSTK